MAIIGMFFAEHQFRSAIDTRRSYFVGETEVVKRPAVRYHIQEGWSGQKKTGEAMRGTI
jgi:hypothetical protein